MGGQSRLGTRQVEIDEFDVSLLKAVGRKHAHGCKMEVGSLPDSNPLALEVFYRFDTGIWRYCQI